MKKYIIIMIIAIACKNSCLGRNIVSMALTTLDSSYIYLNGMTGGDSFKNAGEELRVYPEFFLSRLTLDAKVYNFKDNDKEEGINLSNINDFTYISLYKPKQSYLVDRIWMFLMRGDSLTLEIENKQVYAKGKGANRIQCLWEINKIDWDYLYHIDTTAYGKSLLWRAEQIADTTEMIDLVNFSYERYLNNLEIVDYLYSLKEKILKSYEFKLSPREYEFISFENLAWKDTEYLNSWSRYPVRSSQETEAKLKVFNEIISKMPDRTASSEIMVASRTYADYIVSRDIKLFNYQNRTTNNRKLKPIVESFQKRFSGAFYEKVITALIARSNLNSFNINISEDDLLKIQQSMEIPNYKDIIELYRSNLNKKLNIRSFTLKDTLGKSLDWKQFDGKLLVIDFWFTGCVNCLVLTDAMKPVVDSFRNDPKVVFLSVNMDKDRNKWLQSINGKNNPKFQKLSGKYTHPESVNVSTYPNAYKDPLMVKLNILGAPQLILVDGNGFLVERHLPLPGVGNLASVDELRRVIQKYLNNPSENSLKIAI